MSFRLVLGHLIGSTVCLLPATSFSKEEAAALFDLRVCTCDSYIEPLEHTESLDESMFFSTVFPQCFDGIFCCFSIVEHSCKPTEPEVDTDTHFLLFVEGMSGFAVLAFVTSLLDKSSGLLDAKSSTPSILILDFLISC